MAMVSVVVVFSDYVLPKVGPKKEQVFTSEQAMNMYT
jgi:hypothetical protein